MKIAAKNLPETGQKALSHGRPGGADTFPARKQLPQARTPHEQTALQRQIAAKGGQIDALVCEQYALA